MNVSVEGLRRVPGLLRLPTSLAIYLPHRQKLDLVQQVARRIEAVSGVLPEGVGGGNPEACLLARDVLLFPTWV